MNTGVVSRRFAKALLAYAKGEGLEDKVYKEVKTLAAHFAEVPALRRAVENPVLERSKEKLEAALRGFGWKGRKPGDDAFSQPGAGRQKGEVLAVHDVVVHRPVSGRQAHPHRKAYHCRQFARLWHTLQKLAAEKTHGEVILEEKVDKSLIGGYIIELGGFRLDSSVANQLKRVKQQFIAKNRRIV